jgi:hypothetical protein
MDLHDLLRRLRAGEKDMHQCPLSKVRLRDHSITHKALLTRFKKFEQAPLLPLPATSYDPAIWEHVELHHDGQVVFKVRLFATDFRLLANHARAGQPGQRCTHLDCLPPKRVRSLPSPDFVSTRRSVHGHTKQPGPL